MELHLVDIALVGALIVGFAGAAALAVVEVSLLRVRASRVRVDASQGDRRAVELLQLLGDVPLVLNTVLFLVLLCQVAVATISGYLAERWFGGVWIPVASIAISLLLFVYAESLPKTTAVRSPHQRALRSARALGLLTRVCRPVVTTLVAFAGLHSRGAEKTTDVVSERELRLLTHQAAQAGEIGEADAELVDRSFAFGDQLVVDVMVARDQIVAVASRATVDDALEIAIAAGHRRVPVYRSDLDDMVGVVRLRDLAAASRIPGAVIANVLKAPLFCESNESIARLIERMRTTGTWLALVQSPHGTTVGLATVEDIVAELMGEIEEGPVVQPGTAST